MRGQRRPLVTVTLIHVTSTDDGIGNTDEDDTTTVIPGCVFEPAQAIAESINPDSVAVLQPAAFNLPGVWAVDANDQLQVGADLWLVIGGGTVWGTRTRVPVTEARRT